MTQSGQGWGRRDPRGAADPAWGSGKTSWRQRCLNWDLEVVAGDDVIGRQCLPVSGHGEELGFLPRVLGSHGRFRAEV